MLENPTILYNTRKLRKFGVYVGGSTERLRVDPYFAQLSLFSLFIGVYQRVPASIISNLWKDRRQHLLKKKKNSDDSIQVIERDMRIDRVPGQRLLLFYCSFTCIYFPGILILLKFNESLYNVGKYKFIPILMILMFAEVIKVSFSMLQSEQAALGRIDARPNARSKKTFSRGLREITKFLVAMLLLFVTYYVIIVLFGAPITTHHEETTMLTVTLATLTFVPACLHLGVDTALLVLTRAQTQGSGLLGEAVSLNIKATLLGAWLGAIAIPLDWDRPWQAWPIPCVIGALVGYMLGHFVTLVKILPALRLNKKSQRS